ncbi:MAG: IS200/IS605 family transposase [Persicimonas sp.]
MPQFWQVFIHVVWGTKKRKHLLRSPIEKVVHHAIRDTARELGLVPIIVNSAWNHTHSLVSWSPGCLIEDAVREFKRESYERVEALRSQEGVRVPELEWQTGHSAFSVSRGDLEDVRQYIADQKDRHRNNQTNYDYEGWLATYPDDSKCG